MKEGNEQLPADWNGAETAVEKIGQRTGPVRTGPVMVSNDPDCYQPQLPELQEPDEHPPPPIGFADDIPKPERGPASTYSTLIEPQVSSRLSSTKNVRSS